MDTADEKITRRADVESVHNKLLADRRAQYSSDQAALEADFLSDIEELTQNKREALVAVGLNSDGSDPQERPTG